MHEATLAIEKLAHDLAHANRTIADYDRIKAMDIENAKNVLRKEMEKALIESDIKREVALAKLEAFEKMTNKDDFNREIREMLKDAIRGLSAIKPTGGNPQKGGGQPDQKQQ